MDKLNLKKWVKERNAVMLSLDKEKIVAFCKKYSVPIPENETAFWAGVHKAIVHINSATEEQKLDSTIWLLEHGFRTDIF